MQRTPAVRRTAGRPPVRNGPAGDARAHAHARSPQAGAAAREGRKENSSRPAMLRALFAALLCSYLGLLQRQWQWQSPSWARYGPGSESRSTRAAFDRAVRPNATTSACLMVSDDNHFLAEWIAYHYHAANLRRLVVLVDPNSRTSPLGILSGWKDRLVDGLTVWRGEEDYANKVVPNEFETAMRWVEREFTETTPGLVEHRARQRLFYTHCLRLLKRESDRGRPGGASPGQGSSSSSSSSSFRWTLLVDVDEFVRVHRANRTAAGSTGAEASDPFSLPAAGTAGSVASVLELLARPDARGGPRAQSSPCVPLPRVRFLPDPMETERGSSQRRPLLATQRDTLHAPSGDFRTNKIAKAIIDLARISVADIAPVDSIHLPVRKHCQKSGLHLAHSEALLVANHYLGSLEEFTYREHDARGGGATATAAEAATTTANPSATAPEGSRRRRAGHRHKTPGLNARTADAFRAQTRDSHLLETDDEIRPWLGAFLGGSGSGGGDDPARAALLEAAGVLAPKSWHPLARNGLGEERCALLFFGLTRSFGDLVLPSLVKHVLEPNARHGCDVYAHFYTADSEPPGRKNPGGDLRPSEIFWLEDAAVEVARRHYEEVVEREEGVLPPNQRTGFRPPTVGFTHDTPDEFLLRRSEEIDRFREATAEVSIENQTRIVPAYFPWKARTYTNTSLDNIVGQWHSIQSVFKLMDYTARAKGFAYGRVGMFRSDALYVTPIDIARLGGTDRYDTTNRCFVTPSFALQPVNDRMVYGPYGAVKIWATKRFDLLEDRASKQTDPGWILHHERFLNASVFPAMEAAGYEHSLETNGICSLRTRADRSAVLSDCSTDGLLPTHRATFWNDPGEAAERARLAAVESIVGRKCSLEDRGSKWKFAVCGEERPAS
ncbi:unnamed protein product [Pseudo-nitzschia multistriata]|uniref:Uncharacterized protein n=1 Tax=Pseudo-nitzschia multistriata TaxID=183589 RepID=A0A448ZC79_9STRA|nr:unnamed protein product [Pseudo-nitzschia multistriata]